MTGLLPEIPLFGENIPWLDGVRAEGRNSFLLPTVKNEAWRYTKLHNLNGEDFIYSPSKFLEELSEQECHCHCHNHNENDDCGCSHECHCKKNPDLFVDLPFDAYQIHFYNGKFVSRFSGRCRIDDINAGGG